MAGANSIFTGDKLLTVANAGNDKDPTMLAKLGLVAMKSEEPLRVKRAQWRVKMRRLFISIVLLVSIATPALAKERIILPAPQLPPNYQQMASSLVLTMLREPETAKIEYRSPPYQMVCKKGVFKNKERLAIWMIDIWVNAKNGYGGFTGFQGMSVALFEQDGSIIQQSYNKFGGGAITRFGLCKKVGKS